MSDAWRMSAEDAEEYTRALGQIMSGGWRQIALGQRLGVPQALGMTTDAWVRERIGGYVRLGVDERREAVKELTDEHGEFQLSGRQAAEVLGIGEATVRRDRRPAPDDARDEVAPEEDADDGASDDAGEEWAKPEGLAFVMPEQERESEEERAYYAFTRQRLLVRLDAQTVADAATHPEAALPGFEEFAIWFSAFMARLRANAASPVRAVR